MSEQKSNKTDMVIYKVRTYLSCMNQGIKLPTRHILDLSKYLIPSLLCSAVFAVVVLLLSYLYPLPFSPKAQFDFNLTNIILTVVFVTLMFVLCEGCFLSQLFHVVSKYADAGKWQSFTWKQSMTEWRRFYPRVLLFLAVGVLVTALVSVPLIVWLGIANIWVYVLIFVWFVFVLIPYTMVGWDFSLSHDRSFSGSLLRIKEGYRYFGSYSAVWLVCGLLTLAMSCVVWLPSVILLYAQRASMLGEFMGDVSDLPGILIPLLFLLTMVSAVVGKLFSCLLFFPLTYLYGSIVTRCKEEAKYEEEEKGLTAI